MKVVHLIDHLGPGGSQSILLDLVESRGTDVEIETWTLSSRALPETERRLRAAGVRRRNFALERSGPLGLLRLRARLRSDAPDILDLHLDVCHSLGTACGLTVRPRPALVLRLENLPSVQYSRLWRAGLSAAVSRVDACLAVSHGVLHDALDIRRRARRVDVIRPGIDIGHFESYEPDREELARFRGGAAWVVGSVGRLVRQKGYDLLLEAMPRLLADRPGLRLVIAGEGPERRALEDRAGALGIRHAVRLVGHLPDPRALYAAMDVFLLPSRHEGYGVVFLEAMAMGVPVLGTRVVGSDEAVRDGRTGILVPPGDADVLAHAVSRLLGDPARRRSLAAAAREWLRSHGNRGRMAERTETLYRELLAARRSEGGRRPHAPPSEDA